MMNSILRIAAVVSLLVASGVVAASYSTLRTTTLTTAWRWSLGTLLVWLVACLVAWASTADLAVRELLWYAATLVALCPPIAVLGARRPGAAAWTWFVLLPLLAVLGWPVLTIWEGGLPIRALQLETPQLIGFVLVLFMGTGNYIGTKFWASACLYAVAVCMAAAPLSALSPDWVKPATLRLWGSCLIGLSAVIAFSQPGSRRSASPLDQLLDNYRNTFGIVWSRRLQERLNAVAIQQKWPVRVTPDGLDWDRDASSDSRNETASKIEQSLRWMLRRFVTPEWIDQRLEETQKK